MPLPAGELRVDDTTGMAKSLYVTDSDNGQGLEKRDVYYHETDGTLHLGSENGPRINAYDALMLPFIMFRNLPRQFSPPSRRELPFAAAGADALKASRKHSLLSSFRLFRRRIGIRGE